MGCSNSKDTETKDQNKPTKKPEEKKPEEKKVENKPDDAAKDGQEEKEDDGQSWVTTEKAAEYIMKELNVSKKTADKIVARANSNDDDKVEKAELKELWASICQARDELKPMFEEVDKDNSGKVSVSDASKILEKKFDRMDPAGLKKLLKAFDSGDNVIEWGEFILFYSFLLDSRNNLRPIFEAADANGTGTVTLTEAHAKLMEKYPNMEERPLKKMLYRFDNGDGNIKYEEFIGFYAQLRMSKKAILKKFAKLDKDGNGRVPESAVVKLLSEETGMDEDDCKALVNSSDEGNDATVSSEEFINTWSRIMGS